MRRAAKIDEVQPSIVEALRNTRLVDLSGMKFGRLSVIDRAENVCNAAMWNVVCECGCKKAVRGGHLKSGRTVSCGCAISAKFMSVGSQAKSVRAPRQISKCAQCRKEFTSSPSSGRIFCSYQCHLDSGGAFRAGIASSKAIMKYGPKKDANHNEVMEEMRKHCPVWDLSPLGNGVPDGIAWVTERWILFDIKNPKTAYGRKGLNAVQKKWITQFQGGPVYLLYGIEDAQAFAKGEFDGLKKEGGSCSTPKEAA